MIFYKALSKAEIAQDADVSLDVVQSWCRQKEDEMKPFGYIRTCKVLNPACVRILAEHFCFTPHNAIINETPQ